MVLPVSSSAGRMTNKDNVKNHDNAWVALWCESHVRWCTVVNYVVLLSLSFG